MAYLGKEPVYGNLVKQNLVPDGITTSFALNYYVSTPASLIVSVGGVVQSPDVSYTIAGGGNTLVFDEAPASGLDIFVIFLGVQNLVNVPVDCSVTTEKIANSAVTTSKLAASGVTAATYGNASLMPSFTVDCTGRITTASNISLATGVQPGSYGNATYVPSFSVDSTGRITSACNLIVNSASDLYPCYTVCPGQCIIKGTPVGISSANVFNLCGDVLTACYNGIQGCAVCNYVSFCCGAEGVCEEFTCYGDSTFFANGTLTCVLNQGTRVWSVIEQTSANTMLMVSVPLAPIAFNSPSAAFCAGCCNTANVFCCSATLTSPCWKFANFCVSPDGVICNPNVCCLAACPCVGCVQCTNFSLYCRQCSQRIPWPGPITAYQSVSIDSINGNTCGCQLDSTCLPLLTVCLCSPGAKAQGRPGGILGTQHKFAVSCTGNVAYLMFYESPSGVNLSACCNMNWRCHPFSVLRPCDGVRSMMVFSKCTGSNLFCTYPTCYCCYTRWAVSPSNIRFGHFTRNKRFMFDETVTCRCLCSTVCVVGCNFNCTCIYVAEVNDTFCPSVSSAGIAGTGSTFPTVFYPQNTTGGNQIICWQGDKTRWFPLAENCDGWIIGYKPLSSICIECSNNSTASIRYHLTASVPRFRAIKPLSTGTANVTSFVCGTGYTSNVSLPWLFPTSLCETPARCCNFTLWYHHCANNFNTSPLVSNVCTSNFAVNNGFTPPATTLVDIIQVCPNVMRAYFVTQWPSNYQPSNGSQILCICNVGAACTFYTYHCMDLCVNNATNTVCILSEPTWRDLCTGSCVTCCNNLCMCVISNMVCGLGSNPEVRYTAGYNFALLACELTFPNCFKYCIGSFQAPAHCPSAIDIDWVDGAATFYTGAEGGYESYAVSQFTCLNVENGRLIDAYYLSSCAVNCLATSVCCCSNPASYYITFCQVYGRDTPTILAGSCFCVAASCNRFISCIVLGECTRSCTICTDAVTNIGTGYAYGFMGNAFGCYTVITSDTVNNGLFASRVSAPNQNNTGCFIGFAAATGCGGACIPVAVGRLNHFVCDIKCFDVGVCPIVSTGGNWCLRFTGYPSGCLNNFCTCPLNWSPCICTNCTTLCISTLARCLCIMCDCVNGIKNGCYFN